MKKILLLAPRLDVTFKEGSVPTERGPIAPIREHWKRFIDGIVKEYCGRKSTFVVSELPLWQFSPELVNELNPDIVFIPHKESHNFKVNCANAYYYMQTTFPWFFSIDKKGWAGGSSVYPFEIQTENASNDPSVFLSLKKRANNNFSKFDQPQERNIALPDQYVFFPCQIPHDETIKYHSEVSVEKALEDTCKATKELGISLVVKGHPVNPGSMMGLKDITKNYNHVIWHDNVSIHQLIPQAKAVVVVNSGVGMESLLHKIPVITLGRSEYDCVTNKVVNTLAETIQSAKFNEDKVYRFFNAWSSWCYDSTKPLDYCKLPS